MEAHKNKPDSSSFDPQNCVETQILWQQKKWQMRFAQIKISLVNDPNTECNLFPIFFKIRVPKGLQPPFLKLSIDDA